MPCNPFELSACRSAGDWTATTSASGKVKWTPRSSLGVTAAGVADVEEKWRREIRVQCLAPIGGGAGDGSEASGGGKKDSGGAGDGSAASGGGT